MALPHHKLDAPVFGLAFVSIVIRDWLGTAVTFRLQSVRRQSSFYQIIRHRLGALFQKATGWLHHPRRCRCAPPPRYWRTGIASAVSINRSKRPMESGSIVALPDSNLILALPQQIDEQLLTDSRIDRTCNRLDRDFRIGFPALGQIAV